MARLAQRLKVVIGIISAVGDRTNVMNLGRGDETVSREAKLAKRMLGNIQIPNPLPTSVKALVVFGIATLVVRTVGDRSVDITKTVSCNIRAAWIGAVPLGSKGHKHHLSKASKGTKA